MQTFPAPFELDADGRDQWNALVGLFQELDQKFGMQPCSRPALKLFESFREKEKAKIWRSWEIKQQGSSFKLSLVRFESLLHHPRVYASWHHRTEDFYFFGHLHLERDFGRALIRPETWHDSVREWLDRQELDFSEYPTFCKRYYVLSADEARFRAALPPVFFELMSKVSGLHLEFQGRQCLFRLPKAVEPVESFQLVKIGLALDRILNHKG